MTSLIRDMRKLREGNGGCLPAYAWPGGYPLVYLDQDGCVLCPACAEKSAADPEEHVNFLPHSYYIHYEGDPVPCDNCANRIESAYGIPEPEYPNDRPATEADRQASLHQDEPSDAQMRIMGGLYHPGGDGR